MNGRDPDAAPAPGTVAVIGLGLVGGSLARDLAGLGWRVVAADPDTRALDAARAAGVVADAFRVDDGPPADTRLVVVATPVRAVPAVLRMLARAAPPDAVVTDVGSTKRGIVEAAGAAGLGDRFVGAHPMAGDHRSGWPAARTGLFQGATVWLCTEDDDGNGALPVVASLWRSVGAEPRRIDAAEHDHRVAWLSHLPQLAASALGLALDGAGIARTELGPGGRDASRLAASDPVVWTDILIENGDAVEPALDALIQELEGVRRAIGGLDDASLRDALARARRWAG